MKKIYYRETLSEANKLKKWLEEEYPYKPYMTEITIEKIGSLVYKITLDTVSLD